MFFGKIIQGKHVIICDSESGETFTQYMLKRYSIPFHMSEQKIFLYFNAVAMRKTLTQRITDQINQM